MSRRTNISAIVLGCTIGWASSTAAADTPAPSAPFVLRAACLVGDDALLRSGRKAMMWEERTNLTPTAIYFGPGSLSSDPTIRLPMGPFHDFHFESEDRMATQPKARVVDSHNVSWTAKFGAESRADTVAPRLAWALGFGAVEGYYVAGGHVKDYHAVPVAKRDIGMISDDGDMQPARFKRHGSGYGPVKAGGGEDQTWDMGRNPGVDPEHLSGLILFDVLVNNWDAQPKNCKILEVPASGGKEQWYAETDLGASFGAYPGNKYVLDRFRNVRPMVDGVKGGVVRLNFSGPIAAQARVHRQVPIGHARWFAALLKQLSDDDLRAAFDAAYATSALSNAYASGDKSAIAAAREKEIPAEQRAEIDGFVSTMRARIEAFKQAVGIETTTAARR